MTLAEAGKTIRQYRLALEGKAELVDVGAFMEAVRVLVLTGDKPCATIHDDGNWTFADGATDDMKHRSEYAGWRLPVYASPIVIKDEEPKGPIGHRFTVAELRAMLKSAEEYEEAGGSDRREDEEASFLFYRCGAGEVPCDEGEAPNPAGIYMADAEVPEEGVMAVYAYAQQP